MLGNFQRIQTLKKIWEFQVWIEGHKMLKKNENNKSEIKQIDESLQDGFNQLEKKQLKSF